VELSYLFFEEVVYYNEEGSQILYAPYAVKSLTQTMSFESIETGTEGSEVSAELGWM
jgi:hypothetical protein